MSKWISFEKRDSVATEERFILSVTEEICAEMERQKINKTILAARLGTSKAFVTQLLSGSRNMTVRTLARIAHVLSRDPYFRIRNPIPEGSREHE